MEKNVELKVAGPTVVDLLRAVMEALELPLRGEQVLESAVEFGLLKSLDTGKEV